MCQHGRRRTQQGVDQICQHGRRRDSARSVEGARSVSIAESAPCKECGGRSVTMADNAASARSVEGAVSVAGRQRAICKEGGSQLCPHGRQRSRCKECGGSRSVSSCACGLWRRRRMFRPIVNKINNASSVEQRDADFEQSLQEAREAREVYEVEQLQRRTKRSAACRLPRRRRVGTYSDARVEARLGTPRSDPGSQRGGHPCGPQLARTPRAPSIPPQPLGAGFRGASHRGGGCPPAATTEEVARAQTPR